MLRYQYNDIVEKISETKISSTNTGIICMTMYKDVYNFLSNPFHDH